MRDLIVGCWLTMAKATLFDTPLICSSCATHVLSMFPLPFFLTASAQKFSKALCGLHKDMRGGGRGREREGEREGERRYTCMGQRQ